MQTKISKVCSASKFYLVWTKRLLSDIRTPFRRARSVGSGTWFPGEKSKKLNGVKNIPTSFSFGGKFKIPTCMVLISMSVILSSERSEFVESWSCVWRADMIPPRSQGIAHWEKWSRNKSFQDSCKRSSCKKQLSGWYLKCQDKGWICGALQKLEWVSRLNKKRTNKFR